MKWEVTASYLYSSSLARDHDAIAAAHRGHDTTGIRGDRRDLGWVCETECEALKIKVALREAGFRSGVRRLVDCAPVRGWST